MCVLFAFSLEYHHSQTYNRYAGDACEFGCPNSCSGNGHCKVFTTHDGNLETTYERCTCNAGYTGADCSDMCPGLCNSQGDCESDMTCDCYEGFVGASCNLECPVGVYGAVCSGNGTCMGDTGEALCECFEGQTGDACGAMAQYAGETRKLSGGAIAGYVGLSVGILVILVIGFYVRRRYTKRITYYEKILADLPADDARIQSLIDEQGLEVPADDNRIAPQQKGRKDSEMVEIDSVRM